MPEFKIEDLVGEVVEGSQSKILKDVVGEMTMSAEIDGKTKTIAREITADEPALFYMEEKERSDFGDREVEVSVNLDGYERLTERLPKKGLEELEKVPYKFKPRRFTPKMKKEALVAQWPTKLKVMKARLDGKGGEY